MRKNYIRPIFGLQSASLALLALLQFSALAGTVEVLPVAGGEGIQQALDQIGADGQVVLSQGIYLVRQPVVLRQNGQTLRGAGTETILSLVDNANCPVVILGPPRGITNELTHRLVLSDMLVDGNRAHQRMELWRCLPNGICIYNNGVQVCDVDDATVERVVCRRCRSGGLVSAGRTRRLTVRDYTAYDNQFDGLACYQTVDSHFSQLNLHDNLAAGISLDLDFEHNVVDGAVLSSNDLGVFMRHSRDNVFQAVTILHSRHDGVFMAQAAEPTPAGWRLYPGTECTGNKFKDLQVIECGGRAFRVNNDSCTDNAIDGGQFLGNAQGGLSQPLTNLVNAHNLTVHPLPPEHH